MTEDIVQCQQPQEELTAALKETEPPTDQQSTDTSAQLQVIPRMDPPPPYDGSHLPLYTARIQRQTLPADPDSGCWNCGPGRNEGCMSYSSGRRGSDYVAGGCLNFDSNDGCMNYRSENGWMNYESEDGCLNYKSNDGCLNYEVSPGGGCLNHRSNRGGCMHF